jgi:hypothetical protein
MGGFLIHFYNPLVSTLLSLLMSASNEFKSSFKLLRSSLSESADEEDEAAESFG